MEDEKLYFQEWALYEFYKFNYTPKNYFEASYFLKDAILDFGKEKSYSIDFKDGKSLKTIVLNKDNAQFAFHHEIWSKLDNKQKANCINWCAQKISKMLTNHSVDVNFISLSNNQNNIAESYLNFNKIYIPFNINPQLILNCIFHELTHKKQRKNQKDVKKYFINNDNFDLTDEECLSIYPTSFNFFNNENLNFALYWFNPKEVGARNKALKFQKQVLKEYEMEFKNISKDLQSFNKIKKNDELNDKIYSLGLSDDPKKAISLLAKTLKFKYEKIYHEVLFKKHEKEELKKQINKCSAEIEFTKQKILNMFNEQAMKNFVQENLEKLQLNI